MKYCSDTIKPELFLTHWAPFVVVVFQFSQHTEVESIILSKCELGKFLATLCLKSTLISWLDLMMSITPKGARICNLCHARCTSCSTFINGWIFRQKKAHTYVHMYIKKGLFTQKRLSTFFYFWNFAWLFIWQVYDLTKYHNAFFLWLELIYI